MHPKRRDQNWSIKRCSVPPGWCETPYKFDNSPKAIAGMCYHIHHILQTWHLRTITCSGFCRIFWMVEPLPQTSKTTWTSFLPPRFNNFMSVESISSRKMAKDIRSKWRIHIFNFTKKKLNYLVNNPIYCITGKFWLSATIDGTIDYYRGHHNKNNIWAWFLHHAIFV